MKKAGTSPGATAAELIAHKIDELGDWRGKTLARMRKRIRAADARIVEEWKWGGPVWSCGGVVCTGEVYKEVVKFTFAQGAALGDPTRIFNASLVGKTRRALDLREGEDVETTAFQALVRAAIALNTEGAAKPAKKGKAVVTRPVGLAGKSAHSTAAKVSRARPALLSGGNPQVAIAAGDAPVQAYIAAMPGWKRGVGRRLDALITRTVPGVRKAVKWNTPFYGMDGQSWFLGFHCFTNYVKVTFLRGADLRPLPPVASKDKDARYLHVHEDGAIDEKLFTSWIRQASKLPGWVP